LPVPLQLVASALVGLSLSLAAFWQFEQGRTPFGREAWVPLLFHVLFVTPSVIYLGLAFPDWSWLYLVEPRRLPFGTITLSVLATALAELGGYLGGWALLKARRRRELTLAVGLGTLTLIVVMLVLRERLSHAGTYAEYALGQAVPIAERKLSWALSIIGSGTVVGLVLAIRFLLEQGQREREG